MYFNLICKIFLLSLVSLEAISAQERHQVVIVGAGASGIAAAATLLEHNITDVIILEASDRVGGRIHTVEFGGIPVDKGAEFVHGETNNLIYDVFKPYNLTYSYMDEFFQPDKPHTLFTNTEGAEFNSTYVTNVLDKGLDILDSQYKDTMNISAAEFLDTKLTELFKANNVDQKLGESLRHVVYGRQCIYYAVNNVSDMSYAIEEVTQGDHSLKWLPKSGGFKIALDYLMKRFPKPEEELPILNKTLLNKQVIEVKYGNSKDIEVKCADGSSYLADHVIVTVSLGVLKKHAETMFQPALPERKSTAIKTIGMGNLAKVLLLFPKRWWPENIYTLTPLLSDAELQEHKEKTVHGYWSAYSVGFFPVYGNDRILVGWFAGEACHTMETLTEDDVIDGIMELLQKTFGKKFDIPRPESMLRSTWATNPYTLGAYSYRSVSSDKNNMTNDDLAAPLLDATDKPVVLFAGEATHSLLDGTVQGAIETGRREANRLLDYLQNTTTSA